MRVLLAGEDGEEGLVFATDWRPPYAVGLEEEPVMYIGTDTIGEKASVLSNLLY